MIINESPSLPRDCDLENFRITPLPQVEFQRLIDKGVDEVWYWFAMPSDGGDNEGEMIGRKGNQYRYFCLTQYEDEPIVEFTSYQRWLSFTTLCGHFEGRNDVQCLFNRIREKYGKASFNRKRLQLRITK